MRVDIPTSPKRTRMLQMLLHQLEQILLMTGRCLCRDQAIPLYAVSPGAHGTYSCTYEALNGYHTWDVSVDLQPAGKQAQALKIVHEIP